MFARERKSSGQRLDKTREIFVSAILRPFLASLDFFMAWPAERAHGPAVTGAASRQK